MQIIKAKTEKWDEHGESCRNFLIVAGDEGATVEDIEDEFYYRCGCEHDCCGHVQTRATVRPLRGGLFGVRVNGYRNI